MTVAVLGLGNLGSAMALRLHEQGFTVRGYDVSPAAREASAALGLTVADDVAGAARGASAVCVVVGTAAQASACVDDLLGLGGDATVLVHATLAPADARALADRVGDRLLDAPVSGGPDRARAGRLAVMVGGDPARVAAARAVLDALGRVLVTGAVGTAQVAKLVGQVVFMTTQGALLEGERLAAAYDVDWPVVLESLTEGTADSFAVREWGFFDAVAGAYDASGLDAADRPWAKDLRTALASAADRGVDLPLTAAASRLVPPAIDAHARETTSTDDVNDH